MSSLSALMVHGGSGRGFQVFLRYNDFDTGYNNFAKVYVTSKKT